MPSNRRPDEYVTVFQFMTRELGLAGSDLLVYARVFSFTEDPDGIYFESRASCGEFLNISERQVRRSISRLEEKGLIHEVTHLQPSALGGRRAYVIDREIVSAALNPYRSGGC